MPLTFPGAEAVVEAIYEELRAIYHAVPPRVVFGDEPSGDFGIAHFLGGFPDSPSVCRITFDDNRPPARYVVCHELGHALSWNVQLKEGDAFNGLYQRFWAARGFPGTPWDAQLRAIDRERTATNSGYRLWPEENFADAFGAVNSYGQGTLITETYGAYLDEPRLRAFYKSLEGALDDMDDETIAKIARAVANLILPEVLTKIDSGFNTSIPTLLDRLAAGDKHVETAPVD